MSKKVIIQLVLIIAFLGGNFAQAQFYQNDVDNKVAEFLKGNIIFENDLIVAAKSPRPFGMQEELYKFYQRRNFAPAWIDKNGLREAATTMLELVKEEPILNKGLGNSFDDLMNQYVKNSNPDDGYDITTLGKLEVNLSRAFIYLADINVKGYIMPNDISKYEWYHPVRDADLASVLEFAIMKDDIREGLKSLLPKTTDYWALVANLEKYKEIEKQGGWGVVSDSILKVEIGDRKDVVVDLKNRLKKTEEQALSLNNENEYDEALSGVVSSFQKRHGLETDGKVGSKTLEALNVPVEERIAQIKINIERYKWLPENRGRKHIWVNVPEYMLHFYKDGKIIQEHVVVVGSKAHKTPLFGSRISNIVINPYWNVPLSIARNEILPKLQKGSDYLNKQNFDVIDKVETLDVVEKGDIDWTNTEEVKKKFRFRQKPGPGNALGRLKFNLPNEWGIYLHDTPSKSKFNYAYRAYSHGCIRVKNPTDLAATILNGKKDFSNSKEVIDQKIKSGSSQRVNIEEEVPVYLVYMTSWVDENGTLQFRDDIYKKDKMHAEALEKLTN